MEKLIRIKDSKGNSLITNDSTIQIDHYHNEGDLDYNGEACKFISFIENKCSPELFRAIRKRFLFDQSKCGMLNKELLEWIIGNNTGSSSKTIWAAIMDVEIPSPSIPYDHHDFERCWSLLNLCDKETKETALHKLAKQYKVWKPFVQHWSELETIFIFGTSNELNKYLQNLKKSNL